MQPDLPVIRHDAPDAPTPPGATWSNCLRIGDAVHFSGITARGAGGLVAGGADVLGQTRACIEKLRAQLEAIKGGGLHNVYKLVVYLVDLSRKDDVNAVRAESFGPIYPCSTLVGCAALTFPELLVEIDAFADLRVDLRRGYLSTD